MNKKIIIGLIVVIVIVVAIIIGINMLGKKDENKVDNSQVGSSKEEQTAGDYSIIGESGNKINTSRKLQETKELQGLQINNINLETLGKKTVMLADVKNPTKNAVKEKSIKVELLSENGDVIKTLEGTLGAIEAEGQVQLHLEAEGDYANAYDYHIYE